MVELDSEIALAANNERLLTVDHSARESMKDAAKCEK